MTDQFKETLNELSKDQLIYLIEKFYDSQFIISEICVAESKLHITPKTAIKKIRYNLNIFLSVFTNKERSENHSPKGRVSV